jgi:hypothetical protein
MQHTDHCRDCVVSALLDPAPPAKGVVIDADEERALRIMARAGLIPQIRMKRRSEPA